MRDDDFPREAPSYVTVSHSHSDDPRTAVAEAAGRISLPDTCFVLAFVPSALDCDSVAEALSTHLPGVPVFGCTTAGQITSEGYQNDALLLIAFKRENFRCSSALFTPLKPLSIASIVETVGKRNAKFTHTAGWNRLALVFADGLSKQEDLLASVLESVLEGIPVFGGSAGDGLSFDRTMILHDGACHDNAALLLLVETNLHYQGLSFDHFLPAGRELVITQALTEERLVLEINGAPAAQEYARLIGCAVEDLSPQVFAENPMLVCHKNNHYIRAVAGIHEAQAMSFLAAIDDGLIMTLGRGKEILQTLEAELDLRTPAGAPPDFILAFDCVLRKLEIEQKQLGAQVSDIFRRHSVFGFNTYGEQHRGLHMNQTFVGIAFFDPEGSRLH
ncbi:FIST N-terminal domain-containing protein [Ponticoccus alexandrii]|uniref:FIST signal transduction protein n=1 Tax=Ponticoccus alexandrii TaxID=1943633 RepID=A0ABX7F3K0_9RHOB|nr:FIST N-terminal domain-containing protein [Ponticoccus alexandrii]ETA53586.1 FIST signal transduction protein [Rhodobacteraceae bacterium PD-2]QRF64903.1 FIST signal transduction protein [Ponticoccus alexandrii]